MSETMPEAAAGLQRLNGELLEVEAHLFDLLLAMQLRPKRPRPARPGKKAPRRPGRHPSSGFPGHLFGGKGKG